MGVHHSTAAVAVAAIVVAVGWAATSAADGQGPSPQAVDPLSCAIGISVTTPPTNGTYNVTAGSSKTLSLRVYNTGTEPVNLSAHVTIGGAANASQWSAELNRSNVTNVAPMQYAPFWLTVRVAQAAPPGSNATATVVARDESGLCQDHTVLPFSAIPRRELRLSGQTVLSANNSETVTFHLSLSNRGGVAETVRLEKTIGVGEDWPLSLSAARVELEPGAAHAFDVNVTVPAGAPGQVPALFSIAAYSEQDPTVRANIQITVVTRLAFAIVIDPTPSERHVFPGETALFSASVTNVGNLASAAKIDVNAQKPTNFPGWTATLDRNVVYLRGGESTAVELQVYVAPDASGDTRVELVISGFSQNYAVEGRAATVTVVLPTCAFELDPPETLDLEPGTTTHGTLTLRNRGNAPGTGNFSVTQAPQGWLLAVGGGGSMPPASVPAMGFAQYNFTVTVPLQTKSWWYSGQVQVSGPTCGFATAWLGFHVLERGAVSIEPVENESVGVPGGEATFAVAIGNHRNADAYVRFLASVPDAAVPADQVTFWEQPPSGEPDRAPLAGGRILIPPFGRAHVVVAVQIPEGATLHGFQVLVEAMPTAGELQRFPLHVGVLWPDLAVSLVHREPGPVAHGDTVEFTVTLENTGTRESSLVLFSVAQGRAVFHNQTVHPVAPGQTVRVTVKWSASAGVHDLSFFFVVVSGPAEHNRQNDIVVVRTEVGGVPAPMETASSLVWMVAMLLTEGLALILIGFLVWRRERNKWWPPWPPRRE